MSYFVAVLDACVLYPAPLRDLLLRLAHSGLFQAKWTAAIHDEWIRNVLNNRKDLAREKLERTRQLMDKSILDCNVTGYEKLIAAIDLPDPFDRHILAAAIHSESGVIVTYNLRDFPATTLAKYGIEPQHPDRFIANLLEIAPRVGCSAVKCQRKALKHPPYTAEEFLASLEKQKIPMTIAFLRQHIDHI